MSKYKFGSRSLNNLKGVHPDLLKVVHRALELSEVDFSVIEGVRTQARQAELFKNKASRTMLSRHLTGHAVDLYPVGKPTPWEDCKKVAIAMFKAAKELKIPLRWGGDWNQNGRSDDERFYDGPHFELPRKDYP